MCGGENHFSVAGSIMRWGGDRVPWEGASALFQALLRKAVWSQEQRTKNRWGWGGRTNPCWRWQHLQEPWKVPTDEGPSPCQLAQIALSPATPTMGPSEPTCQRIVYVPAPTRRCLYDSLFVKEVQEEERNKCAWIVFAGVMDCSDAYITSHLPLPPPLSLTAVMVSYLQWAAGWKINNLSFYISLPWAARAEWSEGSVCWLKDRNCFCAAHIFSSALELTSIFAN